ncbi:MAG TPA: hypothetical protein DCZ03_16215 [Gammaproteobacteria bacterium]|nr:hypothetical protein [Gammaproteobacteria bacterium]
MRRLKRFITLLLVGLGVSAAPIYAAGPTFFQYLDENGQLHLNQTIPPHLVKNGYKIVDIRGNVIKEIAPAKSLEELAAEKLARIEADKLKRERQEAKKQDQILLQSFSDESDLIFARDSKLEAIQGTINLTKQKLQKLEENLVGLESRAGDLERAGKSVDQTTLDSIAEVQGYIEENKQFIVERQEQMRIIREEMDAQLDRYRFLRNQMSQNN